MARRLGFASASILGVALLVGAIGAQAATFGYGQLVGTWDADVYNQPNPTGSYNDKNTPDPSDDTPPGNYVYIGNLILDVPGWEDAFLIEEFNFAGAADGWDVTPNGGTPANTETTSGVVFDKTDSDEGTWDYLGVPETDAPVDLYVAVKYGNYFSIFFYDGVDDGDSGLLTSNYQLAGVEGPVCAFTNGFSPDCMPWNPQGNAPLGISHTVAYWPPDGTTESPEPATLALFGAGLIGFGALRRRRK